MPLPPKIQEEREALDCINEITIQMTSALKKQISQ